MNDFSKIKEMFPQLVIYEKPTEEKGNFYFVKKYNEKLYNQLLVMEGKIKTDIKGCTKLLRDTLACFFQDVFKDDKEALTYAIERSAYNKLSIAGYLQAAKAFPRLNINVNAGYYIKKIANDGAHWMETDEEDTPRYDDVVKTMSKFQDMLKSYYMAMYPADKQLLLSIRYNEDYQPINDLIVYDIEIDDSKECEAQYLCYRSFDDGETYQYYVVRQYSAQDFSLGDKREEDVLNKLWNQSIRSPQGIVKYIRINSIHSSKEPKDEKTFICYQVNGKPYKLCPEMMSTWTVKDKMELISLLTEGILELHKQGIYHRNLQPAATYIYYIGDKIGINLVNFEFSKITESSLTVFDKAVDNFKKNILFTAPELRGKGKPSDYLNTNWEKADIYSLGVMFAYILYGGNLGYKGTTIVNIQALLGRYPSDYPKEMKQLILEMCSNIIEKRPPIVDVYARIMTIY